jgi:hypothetical protein
MDVTTLYYDHEHEMYTGNSAGFVYMSSSKQLPRPMSTEAVGHQPDLTFGTLYICARLTMHHQPLMRSRIHIYFVFYIRMVHDSTFLVNTSI